MKFYEFLNEMARISFKNMSPEEIVKTILENMGGNIQDAINRLEYYAKHAYKDNAAVLHKIHAAVEILKKQRNGGHSSQQNNQQKTSTNDNESKYIDEQVRFYMNLTKNDEDFLYYYANIKRKTFEEPESAAFYRKVLLAYTNTWREKQKAKKEDAWNKKKSQQSTQQEDNTFFDKVKGVKFCLTGKFVYPRTHVEGNIKEAGGYIYDIKYCDVLVCADINSNSSKMRYAKANGIKIITYNDLYKVINQNPFGDKQSSSNQHKEQSDKKWTMDDVYKKVDGFLKYDEANGYDALGYDLLIKELLKKQAESAQKNLMNDYNFWTEVLNVYKIKYTQAKAEYKRKKDEEARKRQEQQQQKTTFTSQQKAKVKELILKNVSPIPKDKFSYRSLLMKTHPDFHDNDKHNKEVAIEMTKLVNANRSNLEILKQYARDWKLLSEKQEFINVYEYLLETINKY